jgi:ABC-type Na+ efflux pump permease subunit
MHNIFIIAKREYLERVRTRSFVIMTFLIPGLMIGVSVVPTMLANRGSNETKHMVVVAADRDTAEQIRSKIEQDQDKTAQTERKGRQTGKSEAEAVGRFPLGHSGSNRGQKARLCDPRPLQLR